MSQRNSNSLPDASEDCMRGVSHWLIHHAASRAPSELAERLEEEWRADMSARTSGPSRLRFALGCCWATRVIAWEQQPATVPAASAAGIKYSFDFVPHTAAFYSRRSISLILVIGAHAAVLIGLMVAIGPLHVPKVPDDLQVKTYTNPPPHERVRSDPPKIDNDIHVRTESPQLPPIAPEPPILASIDDTPLPPLVTDTPQQPTHLVKRVQGGEGAGFPDPAGRYPAAAIRLGQQGLSVVQVCVNAKGRLTSAPVIAKSSGIVMLDDAAVRLARDGSGHYRPTTEDGVPVDSCYPLGVTFKLQN